VIIGPTSQVSFEGKISVFSCQSDDSLFWQVNGEFFDFSKSESRKGFEFSDELIDSNIIRKLFIMASADTNNTVINCLSVDSENHVTSSSNATLTVIGMFHMYNFMFICIMCCLGSPSNFKLDLVDDQTFSLRWEQASTPEDYFTHNYTIAAQYKYDSSNPLSTSYTVQANNETEVYLFNASIPSDWLPLGECAQLTFSLVSNNDLGMSPPVLTTWEKPLEQCELSGFSHINFNITFPCSTIIIIKRTSQTLVIIIILE